MTKNSWLQAAVALAALLGLAGVGGAAETIRWKGRSALGAEEWKQLGLEGVALQTVAVDAINDQILYAGGGPELGSGLWKSADGGATWAQSSDGLGEVHRVNSIAIEPANGSVRRTSQRPSAAGETRTVLIGVLKLRGPNLFRSTDGGATWQPSTTGLPNTVDEVTSIVFDPLNPATVFAALNGPIGGVVKSRDGGQTWSDVSLGRADGFCARGCVLDLAIDPSSPLTVYAAMPALADVYKTTSGGEAWSPTGVGLWPERVEVAMSAPATVFTSGTVPGRGAHEV